MRRDKCITLYTQWAMHGYSYNTGTELTGWSRYAHHCCRMHTLHTDNLVHGERWLHTWRATRCHVLSIYTSRCYVAPACIAAHLLQYSLQQCFTEDSGMLLGMQTENTLAILLPCSSLHRQTEETCSYFAVMNICSRDFCTVNYSVGVAKLSIVQGYLLLRMD